MNQLLANLLWMSPLWAWAAVAAVGIPLLAHLLNRRRYRTIVFPAVELLREAVIRTARVCRPRHLWLLLLRTLALSLIVLGFMRPVWQADAVARPASDGQVLVIVLDASASMQRTSQGRAGFDQARDRAAALLDQLEPGRDRASVYLLTDRLTSLLPEPTGNLTELRRRLALARCTWEADRPDALGPLLADQLSRLRPSHVVWISDGQHGESVGRVRQQLDAAGLSPVFSHSVVGQSMANASVHLQDLRPYPPVAGQPLAVTVRVRHVGEVATQRTLVAQHGGEVVRRQVTLGPDEDRLVTLELEQVEVGAGWLTVGFEDNDAFAADDRTGIELQPLAKRSAVLWTDDASGPLANRVRAMLAPGAISDGSIPQPWDVTPLNDPSALARLSPNTTLIIANQSDAYTPSARAHIDDHLQRGGGVVWFADTAASRRALTGRTGPVVFREEAAGARAAGRARLQFDRSELEVFEGPSRGLLAGVVWPGVVGAELAESGQVIIAAPDGTPIVAAASVGRGTLYAINADPAADDYALTLDPAFVVLFNELTRRAAAGQAMPAALHPGQRVPGAEDGRIITEPGPDASGRWVEIDPRESDLFDQQDGMQPGASQSTASVAWAGRGDALLAGGTVLWPYLLLGALALFAVEAGVLIRYRTMDQRGVVDA